MVASSLGERCTMGVVGAVGSSLRVLVSGRFLVAHSIIKKTVIEVPTTMLGKAEVCSMQSKNGFDNCCL